MSKNYLNMEHMARNLPQMLRPQPHCLLTEDEQMEDSDQDPTWNGFSDSGVVQSANNPNPAAENFLLAKFKQVTNGGMKALSKLTNRLSLSGAAAEKTPTPDPTTSEPATFAPTTALQPLPVVKESRSLQNLNQATKEGCNNLFGASSSLMEKCHSWVELREMDTATSKYNELENE